MRSCVNSQVLSCSVQLKHASTGQSTHRDVGSFCVVRAAIRGALSVRFSAFRDVTPSNDFGKTHSMYGKVPVRPSERESMRSFAAQHVPEGTDQLEDRGEGRMINQPEERLLSIGSAVQFTYKGKTIHGQLLQKAGAASLCEGSRLRIYK